MSAVKIAVSAVATGVALAAVTGVHHHHDHWSYSLDSFGATPVNVNAALARRLAGRDFGWRGRQWRCENTLWNGESSFSNTADTRVTGLDPADAAQFAYGIPQARAHGAWVNGIQAPYPPAYSAANPPQFGGTSDTRTQILWGDAYIQHTYGTPCAALASKQASGNQGY